MTTRSHRRNGATAISVTAAAGCSAAVARTTRPSHSAPPTWTCGNGNVSAATGWGPEETRTYLRPRLRSASPTWRRSNRRTPAASPSSKPPGRQGSRWCGSTKRTSGKAWAGSSSTSAAESVSPARSPTSIHSTNRRPNLTVLTGTKILKVLLDDHGDAIGAETDRGTIYAGREVIVCCGAFDTPKLLLLSGIGPEEHLREAGVETLVDLPGVGENLLDHPEGIVMWESSRPVPEVSTQFWEAGLFACTDPVLDHPDLMFHFGTVPFRPEHGAARLPYRGPGLLHNAERGAGEEPGCRTAALLRPVRPASDRLPLLYRPRRPRRAGNAGGCQTGAQDSRTARIEGRGSGERSPPDPACGTTRSSPSTPAGRPIPSTTPPARAGWERRRIRSQW